MNIIKKHRLSFMLIMMSAQSFLCHANKTEDSFAILADDMYNKAHLFVDHTYVITKLNPEILQKDLTMTEHERYVKASLYDFFANIMKPVAILKAYVKKCDDNRRKKDITCQHFSSEKLSHFFFQAEQAIYRMHYSYYDPKDKTDFIYEPTEKSDAMKKVIKQLNTMQSPLFAYCLSFIYLKMKLRGIEAYYTFFFDDSLAEPETDPAEQLNIPFNNMKLT